MSRHFVADTHRDDGKRYVVRADEKLTAFLELEMAIYEFAVDLISQINWHCRVEHKRGKIRS
jgi:hypothetical protein